MTWQTLVRGPDGLPTPHPVADKERKDIRAIDGATLYECEAHALASLREHHTPPKVGHRFIAWKQSVYLYVVPLTPEDLRMRAKRRGQQWSDR